jgi:uncharacterized delta-60 repeat protein
MFLRSHGTSIQQKRSGAERAPQENHMKKKISARLVFLFLFLLLTPSIGFPGSLDPTFATGGKFTMSFPDSTMFYRSSGYRVYVQPSNRIVAGGSFSNIGPDGYAPGVALLGLTPGGTVDSSYASQGSFKDWNAIAFTSFGNSQMLADGRILRLSQFFAISGFPSGNIYRQMVDGLVDSGFSASINVGSSNTIPEGLAVLPSGKIMVLVFAQTNPESYTLYRLNSDGSRDATFGTNGAKPFSIARLPDPEIESMTALPDGKFVIAGQLNVGNNFQDFDELFIARFNPDGSLDGRFGRQGVVRYKYGAGLRGFVNDMIVRVDGSYVLAGGIKNPDLDTFMIGLTRRGKFDATFGVRGVAVTDIAPGGNDLISAFVESGGKLIAAGEAPAVGGSPVRFLMAKFSAAGALEAHTKTEFTAGQYSAAYGLTVQPDGKILGIGVTANPAANNNTMWAIARYTDITNDQ